MATSPRKPMTDTEVKATRKQVTHLIRHSSGQPPAQLIHYALDLETPPLIACDTPTTGAIWSTTPGEVTCPRCTQSDLFPRSLAIQQPGIREYDVLMNAADLLSDEGENPEYDRAIVELTTSLIGTDDSILVARILRALKQGE